MARGHAVQCDICDEIEFTDGQNPASILPPSWIKINVGMENTNDTTTYLCSADCLQELFTHGIEGQPDNVVTQAYDKLVSFQLAV